MKLIAALFVAALSTGCAHMTPEERSQFGQNLAIGLAVGAGAGLAARAAYQPVYVAPVYQMPIYQPRTTTCNRFGNTMTCDTF